MPSHDDRSEADKLARMRDWLKQVSDTLGVDAGLVESSIPTLLDLVRDVAHGPSRPGAPLTAFVVGLALSRDLALDQTREPGVAVTDVVRRLDPLLAPYRGEG